MVCIYYFNDCHYIALPLVMVEQAVFKYSIMNLLQAFINITDGVLIDTKTMV
jgi:hypothetical protein